MHSVVSGSVAGPVSMESRHCSFVVRSRCSCIIDLISACGQFFGLTMPRNSRQFDQTASKRTYPVGGVWRIRCAGNKIRVSPKNGNVKHKLLSKYQKSVSFPVQNSFGQPTRSCCYNFCRQSPRQITPKTSKSTSLENGKAMTVPAGFKATPGFHVNAFHQDPVAIAIPGPRSQKTNCCRTEPKKRF